ncbi:hypothetical protein CRG98_008873 [Punica granatum]|uniref:Uncharacterized protein n=1 Tax=Punica granatum TaxID=22663 RepID=A0A2I0KQN6_PUNGR|nr:hypothetical protein CRG98_008873 [Punica granatum]
MLGRGPKAVNAGPRPDTGPKLKGGAEAQKWGRSPMQGQNPKAGPKPDAVNAGPEADAGPKPNAVNACSIRKCKRCKSKGFQCKSVGKRTGLVGVVRAHRGTYAEDSARAGRDVLARRLVTRSVALREVHRTGQETCWNTWRRRGMVKTLALINKLLVPLCDFSMKTISFGSEISELGLDGHIRSGSCAGTPNGHGSGWHPHGTPLEAPRGSSYPSVACSQDAVKGPDGLNNKGYLITTPSDHLEDNTGQGRIDETMRARE